MSQGIRTSITCGLRTTDYRLRTTDYGLRTADYGLRTTGSVTRVIFLKSEVRSPKSEVRSPSPTVSFGMRYLRMLSNSLVAGMMAAAYLVVLFLQLNPALPLHDMASWGLIATIWAGYGVNFSALFYALIVLQQLLAAEASSPGWFSVRLLAPFCASATVLAAVLMWLNLRGLHAALDDEGVRRMTLGAAAMTACASAFVLVTILRFSIGR